MHRKPMLNANGLINHLQNKGVKFSVMSDIDAESYLSQNNNFFKLTSYRKNYSKYTDGPNKGKYEHLDFAYLIELARIDVEVRFILLKMCLDIEHFLKVYLIKFVEDMVAAGTGEDGYKIVNDYIAYDNNQSVDIKDGNRKKQVKLEEKLKQNIGNPYCGNLFKNYKDDMPIWALVEIISFGDLLDILDFCHVVHSMELPVDRRCLDRVRQIRNATAHNNCIINDFQPTNNTMNTPAFITKYLISAGIGQNMRKKKLSNLRINQIVHLFYAYDKIVNGNHTRSSRVKELQDLLENRMTEHSEYFKNNALLTSTYEFFLKLVKNLYQKSKFLAQN